MSRPLYVETLIRADLDELWRRTQDPAEHERWDARFTRITHLPGDGPATRFRYSTRILPGRSIDGTGTTVGESRRDDGTRTSALRFGTDDRLSPIRRGSGYWRYVPVDDGVRFLTGYQYTPGWGRYADLIVRPLLGWATAWSFDRLRLWLDHGIRPRRALAQALAEIGARLALILAAGLALGPIAALLALSILAVPPLPTTPAARRCLRRAPDPTSGRAPATLTLLTEP